MRSLTVVKLGGSVITFKDRTPPQVNKPVVERLAAELAGHNGPMIIVLGGGAHGHQPAHNYGFGDLSTTPARLVAGIPHIRHNMNILSLSIEEALLRRGVPVVSLAPFSIAKLKNGTVSLFDMERVSCALKSGLVVMTHGDVCFDSERGASILSGDSLVMLLANHFAADTVLIGTDVDGVYDQDPRLTPAARLIPVLHMDEIGHAALHAGPSVSTDVTGGMENKILELKHLTNQRAKVAVFNLAVANRLADLLAGRDTVCTIIKLGTLEDHRR
ncbi:MAG: isopentenyl phosphate kinase family protein [Candidatus Thorarchaeota archaeon]|nr:isopentenyl phosphate kinase family protein [Candidatus Thorarchaeota archaeon]